MNAMCICCDNSGKNQVLERFYKKDRMDITFEYTALGMPQQNGRFQRKVASLENRVEAMLNGGKFSPLLRC